MDQKCALGRGGRCIRDNTHHQDIVVEPHIVPLFKPTGRDYPKLETVRKDEERRNDAIRENLWSSDQFHWSGKATSGMRTWM